MILKFLYSIRLCRIFHIKTFLKTSAMYIIIEYWTNSLLFINALSFRQQNLL